jgi:hypothetical protein
MHECPICECVSMINAMRRVAAQSQRRVIAYLPIAPMLIITGSGTVEYVWSAVPRSKYDDIRPQRSASFHLQHDLKSPAERIGLGRSFTRPPVARWRHFHEWGAEDFLGNKAMKQPARHRLQKNGHKASRPFHTA